MIFELGYLHFQTNSISYNTQIVRVESKTCFKDLITTMPKEQKLESARKVTIQEFIQYNKSLVGGNIQDQNHSNEKRKYIYIYFVYLGNS